MTGIRGDYHLPGMKWLPLLLVATLILIGCSVAAPRLDPPWVAQLIATFQNSPVGNPPQSIWRYEYKGQIVYYIPPQCCDQYSKLFSSDQVLLCAPDGGIIAGGDGRCSDFFSTRTDEKLIWLDPRTR